MNPIRMNLLNSFVVFNESENINVAAKRLGITQPALSKQLKEFESRLEIRVYATQGRRKVLTPFGRSLHVKLKERLGNIFEVMNSEQNRHRSSLHADIRIASRSGILDRMSSRLLFDGTLNFLELSNDQIIDSLRNLNAEIGITHFVPDSSDLVAKPLFKEEFQLLVPKKFLSTKPTLAADLFVQLQKLPCLGYKPEDEIIRALMSSHLQPMKKIKYFRTTENYERLKNMVESEMGWAIIPSYIKVSNQKTWALKIPSKTLVIRQFYLICRKEFTSVPWFKELVSSIYLCFKE